MDFRGKFLKKIGLSKPSKRQQYGELVRNSPIDENAFLLESRHGDAFEGNLFYIARYLLANQEGNDWKVYISTTAKKMGEIESQLQVLPGSPVLVVVGTLDYYRAVATSKYLLNDTSFGHFFYKRPNQIYLNTWHGTPLKYLGRDVVSERISMGNVQRNFLCADILLYPNEYTKNVMFKDYMLGELFEGEVLYQGYPRNEVFFQRNLQQSIVQKNELENYKVYAYMPTYRGLKKDLGSAQILSLREHLSALDRMLDNNEILYLNLHPFMANAFSCEDFTHIRIFPSDVPSYDFLSIADILITDYSSVMFDFLCAKRPIILFDYDLDEYIEERGMYFNIKDLPFAQVQTVEQLVAALKTEQYHYDDVFDRFCPYDSSCCSELIVQHLLNWDRALGFGPHLNTCKSNVLVSVDGMTADSIVPTLASIFDDPLLDKNEYYLSFSRKCLHAQEYIDAIPRHVNYFAIGGKPLLAQKEAQNQRAFAAGMLNPAEYAASMTNFFVREWQRRYGNVSFDSIVSFSIYSARDYFLFSSQGCDFQAYLPSHAICGVELPLPTSSEESVFLGSSGNYRSAMCKKLNSTIDDLSSIDRGGYALIRPHFVIGNHSIILTSIMKMTVPFPLSLDDFVLFIGDKQFHPEISPLLQRGRRGVSAGKGFYHLKFVISESVLSDLAIHNYIRAAFNVNDAIVCCRAIRYNWLRAGYRSARSPYLQMRESGLTAFFRQTKKGNIALTVRNHNVTDSLVNQVKLNAAAFLSKILPFPSHVLVYEKNSSKYEEGGKVFFEYLRNHNYENVRFLLDRETFDSLKNLDSRYKDYFIVTHTLRHYINFFKSNIFIGTETMAHALELRVENRLVKRKLQSSDNVNVFLQHGVMYMVSLNSPQRSFFRKKENRGRMLIVANSSLEKNHFINLGGFDSSDIITTGLPKFDKSFMLPDADLITIMPTWRIWEFNEIRSNPGETKYWQMIERIKAAIPASLQSKVVIQAHPLFNQSNDGRIKQERSIDELLRHTRVLITDYSSVAYDAFYRGCNVLFYWEERDECMEHYGHPTRLMIDDDTAPGYVCYTPEDVTKVVEVAYCKPQPDDQVKKYRDIVEFHDGRNCERLYHELLKRGIL